MPKMLYISLCIQDSMKTTIFYPFSSKTTNLTKTKTNIKQKSNGKPIEDLPLSNTFLPSGAFNCSTLNISSNRTSTILTANLLLNQAQLVSKKEKIIRSAT